MGYAFLGAEMIFEGHISKIGTTDPFRFELIKFGDPSQSVFVRMGTPENIRLGNHVRVVGSWEHEKDHRFINADSVEFVQHPEWDKDQLELNLVGDELLEYLLPEVSEWSEGIFQQAIAYSLVGCGLPPRGGVSKFGGIHTLIHGISPDFARDLTDEIVGIAPLVFRWKRDQPVFCKGGWFDFIGQGKVAGILNYVTGGICLFDNKPVFSGRDEDRFRQIISNREPTHCDLQPRTFSTILALTTPEKKLTKIFDLSILPDDSPTRPFDTSKKRKDLEKIRDSIWRLQQVMPGFDWSVLLARVDQWCRSFQSKFNLRLSPDAVASVVTAEYKLQGGHVSLDRAFSDATLLIENMARELAYRKLIQRKKLGKPDTLLEIIAELQNVPENPYGAPLKDILKIAEKEGLPSNKAERLIQALKVNGLILEPRPEYYKKI